MDQDGLDQAITFVWATWRFWWLRGHTAELARVREKFMAMRREMAPHERALVLSGTGFTFMRDGDLDKAQPAFEQSLPLFSEAGIRWAEPRQPPASGTCWPRSTTTSGPANRWPP